jgi:tetratricopeptide (TPR) repeat protein
MRRIVLTLAATTLATSALAADKKVEEAYAKAESQLAKGRTDEADKTMQKVVQQVPGAESQTAYARIQLKAGNEEGAAASAAEAVKLASSAPPEVKAQAHAVAGELALRRGAGKDAVTHAQEAITAANTPEHQALLARAQARSGDPASVATAQKAVEAGATQAAAHEALGHALQAMQRGEEAVAAFRKALELDVKRTSARTGLAGALLLTGKAADAVTEARKATEEDPRSGEAFAVLGSALLAAAPSRDAGWPDAIAQAQQGAFLSPRNPVVQMAVGRLFEAGGNLDQAGSAYRKALEADPGFVAARVELLQIQSRKGDLVAAEKEAREIVKAMPQSAQAQLALGRILARKGDWEAAMEPLELAAKALPTVGEAQALAGTAYQYNGQSAEALEAYKKAVALAPNNLDYRSTYGLLLGLSGDPKAGVVELEKVTASPSYKEAAGWVNLGWVYRNVDPPRADDSARAYEKALTIDPKNAQAALGLGWAYLTGTKYDQAITNFNKAISLDAKTTSAEAYNGIGWSHFFKKEMPQAKEAAGKAKAAGRNVSQLLTNIDRAEKGEQIAAQQAMQAVRTEIKQEADVGTLGNQLMKGGAGARRSAAAQLARHGGPAVQYLVYAAVNDRDWGVRQTSINSLGAVGGAARSACAQLQGIARSNPYGGNLTATPEEMQNEARYEDLRRAAKSAISRIGC